MLMFKSRSGRHQWAAPPPCCRFVSKGLHAPLAPLPCLRPRFSHGTMRGHLPATSIRLGRSYHQWRRQTKNSFIFSSLWSNLTANYPSTVDNLPKGLVQMSTTFDRYCISHNTVSHRAAAAPGPEVRRECPMT